MQSNYVIDAVTKASLKDKTLLLDTNALLDAYRLPGEFYDLAKELGKLGCDMVTTRTIIIEFLGSTTDTKIYDTKVQFLEALFGKTVDHIFITVDRDAPLKDDLLAFSRQANKFDAPDFELYCQLVKYKSNIALLTRNHKDFSANLCNRISFITLLGNKEIHTYGVYSLG